MPKMQECIKLNTIKKNDAFLDTNYSKKIALAIESFAQHHQLKLFTQNNIPIANFTYTESSIIEAIETQSYPITIHQTTYIMTCNPFHHNTQKKYKHHTAYITTPSLFIDHLAHQYTENPTEGLWNILHFYGANQQSTDIHISPSEGASFNKNGRHQLTLPLRKESRLKLLYFIKLNSQLDPAITKTPQDGAYQFKFNDTTLDVRVATLPTQQGEMISLRLFNKNKTFPSLKTLGFSEKKSLAIKKMLTQAHGLILITGTTGSGKSTTLYTMLNECHHRHVITLEDPIEKVIPTIHQTSINQRQGYTMDVGLKAILRHNPDVIAIGEIRDNKTAEVVINAAYSGHLVIASLHTNSIEATILRLSNLGISPFLISYCLRGIISQSLTHNKAHRLQLNSQLLVCNTPYMITNIKKELTEFLNHNTLIE